MSRYKAKQLNVDKDWIEYVSPSQILGQLSKGEGLTQWAINCAIDYIENYKDKYIGDFDGFHKPLKNVRINPEMLEESRTAWKNIRDNTADIGSQLHILVEKFINIKISMYKTTMYEGKKTKESYFLDYISKQPYQLKQMFYQFYVWQKKHVKRFIESEKPVIHRDLAYCGTLDYIYEGYDGLIYCDDLKTSNSIYKTHETQVVSYKYARESMNPVKSIDMFESFVNDNEPTKYQIQFNQDGNTWTKTFNYPLIKIDKCGILRISRDFLELEYKIVKEEENKMRSFKALLTHFYSISARRLKNARAKNRK